MVAFRRAVTPGQSQQFAADVAAGRKSHREVVEKWFATDTQAIADNTIAQVLERTCSVTRVNRSSRQFLHEEARNQGGKRRNAIGRMG
jgi:hypothetical protein